ncbi:Crp/Fnr family transcriptional regulator [Tichowtungia aerotolerans]|uniref:Cyclic nucleotide-binding domain-containing protein n=1 Tax=Tichowtungia aerotolerans TaxID=2697043 RepID=A0A6P1M975_9BACT|nr:cyclic nucleotide-binding domain-containing protein [Tichowtungia aerotolerans]QHI69613.1 cyclic nucleotide-binding domain-containing protein [Tichowtungia aerotolerans]
MTRQPLLNVEEILPILNRISVFGALDDTQLYTVFHLLEVEVYKKGDVVFEQGDSPTHIRIVKKGAVRIVENLRETPLELYEFDVGDCFGETAVIGILPHTASAVAIEDCELLVFPREKLFGLYDSDPRLFGLLILNIAREACRRLCQTEEVMLHYALEGHSRK